MLDSLRSAGVLIYTGLVPMRVLSVLRGLALLDMPFSFSFSFYFPRFSILYASSLLLRVPPSTLLL
jgi:hypothetical protein